MDSKTMRASKANINYNGIELEVYQLPNGEYHLSKTQVGKAIDKHHDSMREFISGNSPEALPYKDFTFAEIAITDNPRSFHSVPLNIASAYWTYWASKGNVQAQALVSTSVVESLTRLCDNAFGVKRSEEQIQQQNVENVELNRALFTLIDQMSDLNTRMARLTERTERLDKIEENGHYHSGCLGVLEHEPDVEEYFTAREYLTSKGLEHAEFANTFCRRAPQFMRVGKQVETLPSRKGQILYSPRDIPYLEQTLKSILGLD